MIRFRSFSRLRPWLLWCAAGALSALPLTADAHSFRLALLLPETGPDRQLARQALDGLLLATRERDAHEGETSDGHLGGLDVHISVVDTASGPVSVRTALKQLIDRDLQIVAGLMAGKLEDLVRETLQDTPAYVIVSPDPPAAIDAAFGSAFEAMFGYPASRNAWVGYCTGRVIDEAVRELAGDFTDRDRLASAFARASCP